MQTQTDKLNMTKATDGYPEMTIQYFRLYNKLIPSYTFETFIYFYNKNKNITSFVLFL